MGSGGGLVYLRAVAEKAMPGPWHVERDEDSGALSVEGEQQVCEVAEWSRWLGNAAYIAAADPTAVLALLDRVEALKSALERTEANFVAAVNGRPVRDMAETLAENRTALEGR